MAPSEPGLDHHQIAGLDDVGALHLVPGTAVNPPGTRIKSFLNARSPALSVRTWTDTDDQRCPPSRRAASRDTFSFAAARSSSFSACLALSFARFASAATRRASS